jgi:hypothetical protein
VGTFDRVMEALEAGEHVSGPGPFRKWQRRTGHSCSSACRDGDRVQGEGREGEGRRAALASLNNWATAVIGRDRCGYFGQCPSPLAIGPSATDQCIVKMMMTQAMCRRIKERFAMGFGYRSDRSLSY